MLKEKTKQYLQIDLHTNHTLAGRCKLYSRVISDDRLVPIKHENHTHVEVLSIVAPNFISVASLSA